jgi:hypothetical protein
MAAFDKLPPTARDALRDADHNWAASTILARWRRGVEGYQTGPAIASTVAEWDRWQHRDDVRRGLVCPRVAP